MQRLVKLIYPPQCLGCGDHVDAEYGLCPSCWPQMPFIVDVPCDACGRPLEGEAREGDLCDGCLASRPVWSRGRAALVYADRARSLVLSLKHRDRTDLARPLGRWLAKAVQPLVTPEIIVAPVPLHWRKRVTRRYNQAALLSRQVARVNGVVHRPDLLSRTSATRQLDGMSASERFDAVSGSIVFNTGYADQVVGRQVLLIDDVMTSGATLSECARVCYAAGAKRIDVGTLARVAWRP